MKAEYLSGAYHELEVGGGVMRVEAGSIVGLGEDGAVTVMPPQAFAEVYPDFDVASLPVSDDGKTVREPVEPEAPEPALEPVVEAVGEPVVEPVAEDAPAAETVVEPEAPEPVVEAEPVTEPEAGA